MFQNGTILIFKHMYHFGYDFKRFVVIPSYLKQKKKKKKKKNLQARTVIFVFTPHERLRKLSQPKAVERKGQGGAKHNVLFMIIF